MSRYRRSLAEGATFFFTVTLADRRSQLLTREIKLLRRAYRLTRERYPFETVAVCILPDHLHAIWELPENDADFSRRWACLKRFFSSSLPSAAELADSKIHKREKGIWQRRFWEHQIRDELDLSRHVDYIHHNAVKHGLVKRAEDWQYSSFHQYAKDGLLPLDWGFRDDDGDQKFGE